LGKEVIYRASEEGEDIAIIQKLKNDTLAIIITFEKNGNEIQARLRTVIQKRNIFIKNNTKVYCLNNFKGGF